MSYLNGPRVVTDGLVLCYDTGNSKSYSSGSTSIYDLVNTGNTGTLTNGPVYNSDNSGCIDFDGSNDYVSFTKPITSTLPYTVLQWIKPDSALADTTSSASRRTPLVGTGPLWNPGYWLTARILRVHAATQYRDHTINIVGDVGWHQVGQWFDGTNAYGIFDGEILSGGTTAAYAPGSTATILLGKEIANATGVATSWNGKIGPVHFYNRELSASEVLQNFNATKGRFGL